MSDHVKEFQNIQDLNNWLDANNSSQEYIIKKIFKAADKTYFVWYTAEDKTRIE